MHPLFVLFEPSLKCDPRTDHETPKNVYSIYEKSFLNIFE